MVYAKCACSATFLTQMAAAGLGCQAQTAQTQTYAQAAATPTVLAILATQIPTQTLTGEEGSGDEDYSDDQEGSDH
jgi:hypothetical protein